MIVAKELTKKYGDQLALNNINLTIEENKITALIGPNGAGKSTFMKLLCGYIEPHKGYFTINNEKVSPQNKNIKKNIGYLPESNPLYYDMYIKEYLTYVAGIYNLSDIKQSVDVVIKKTGLEKEQSKKIGQLSKGYKQRVGIAQAIIHNPGILILDEPTSGLDPNQLVEIRELIQSLGKNKTVLLSTHILQEVEAICNQVVLINNGEVVINEKTSNINHESLNNIIVEFDKNPDKDDLLLIESVIDARLFKDNTWIISGIENKDIRGDIFNFAVKHNLVILSSQVQKKKLEEIFQSLTGTK